MKFVKHIIFSSLLLSSLLVAWPGQGVYAQGEGAQLLIENPADTSRIMLGINDLTYGNFATFNPNVSEDTSRLIIETLNPEEIIRIGLSSGVTRKDLAITEYHYQIRDMETGDVVYGPHLINEDNDNIEIWEEAKYAPNAGGYSVDDPIYTYRPGKKGKFSLEFEKRAGNPIFFIPNWNFTVVDPTNTTDSIKVGRIWSKHWSFRTPNAGDTITSDPPTCYLWNRTFGGDFYSYTADSLVSRVDFAGTNMLGLSFTIAFNSTGTRTTGNLLERRRSVEGRNATSNTAEHQIFLSSPDPDLFPTTTSECATVEIRNEELSCVEGLFCVPLTVSAPGQVEISWVRDEGDELSVGLSDFPRSVFPASGPLDTCVMITALDSIGGDVGSLRLRVIYLRGAQHWAAYDVEFMDKGFCVTTDLPESCTNIPGFASGDNRLYWDDSDISSVPGGPGAQLSPVGGASCTTNLRSWNNFSTGDQNDCSNIRDDLTTGYGDKSTLNTWWYAYRQELDVVEFTFTDVDITGPETVCTNLDVVYRAEVSSFDTTEVLTYSWSGPDGITSSADTIATNTPGEYCVTVTSENGCERTSCKTLSIGEGPGPDVSLSAPVAFCPGEEVTLSVNNNNLNETLTYEWTPESAFVDNSLAMPDYLEEQGTQEITIRVVSNQSGCETTLNVDITIINSVAIEATIIFDDICTSVDTLRATVTDGATVEWLNESGNVVGTGLELVTNTGPGESTFTARASSTNPACLDTVFSQPLTVRYEPVDITVSGPTEPVCAGEDVILNVTSDDSPRDTLTYVWTPANAFVDNTLAIPDYLEDMGSQTVTVTATNQFGCEDSRPFDITILEAISLEVAVVFDDICTPVDTLRATVTNGATVEWLNEDGNVVGTGLELVTNTGPGESTFTARASSTNPACLDTVFSQPLAVRYEPVDITVSGPTEPVCAGEDVILNVTSDDSPRDTLTYVWTPANAFVDNTLAIPDYLEDMGSQTVTVTATNQFGCEDSRPFDITILEAISLEVAVVFDDICTPVDTLRATVTNGATVEWLNEDGNVVGTGLELVTNTGPGESTFTARASSTNPACLDTVLSQPLTVRYEPADITVIGPTEPVCTGEDVILSATNNDSPRDTLTYIWTPAGAFVDNTLATPDYLENMGSQTVTVTATNQFDCVDSRPFNITILEAISLEVAVVFDDICTPVDTLRATVTDGATVEWLNEDGNVVGTGLELVTNTGPGESTFTARASSTNPACLDTVFSQPLTVHYEPVDITVSGPTEPICAEENVILSVTNDDSPRDTLTYVWTPAGAFVDNTLATPDYLEDMGSQTVTVTATNQFGCEGSRSFDITILEPISLSAAVIFDDICTPVDTLRATVTDGAIVEWLNEDGNVVGTGLELVTNTAQGESTFTARARSANPVCPDTVFSEPLTVRYEPVDIMIEEVCSTNNVALSVINDDANDNLTYVWSPANAFVDNTLAAPDYLEELGSQTVTVTATNQFGCEATESLTISCSFDDCTPNDVYLPNFFSPNGDNSNDVVRLRSKFIEELLEVELMIYNRWGEEVFRTTDKFAEWDGTFRGEQLAPDVYGFWLRYTCPEGEPTIRRGNITLMR
jgi:gliding motility-associated-like protein